MKSTITSIQNAVTIQAKKKATLLELLDALYVDKRKYNLVQTLEEARKIAASL